MWRFQNFDIIQYLAHLTWNDQNNLGALFARTILRCYWVGLAPHSPKCFDPEIPDAPEKCQSRREHCHPNEVLSTVNIIVVHRCMFFLNYCLSFLSNYLAFFIQTSTSWYGLWFAKAELLLLPDGLWPNFSHNGAICMHRHVRLSLETHLLAVAYSAILRSVQIAQIYIFSICFHY